ncbi:hypothetical protein F5X99DRAFT_401912 [Biscogniauxia marginata]|nr:hypothetical protein F5X99DRAFT_401912 [Biscogniauxia marginata]
MHTESSFSFLFSILPHFSLLLLPSPLFRRYSYTNLRLQLQPKLTHQSTNFTPTLLLPLRSLTPGDLQGCMILCKDKHTTVEKGGEGG